MKSTEMDGRVTRMPTTISIIMRLRLWNKSFSSLPRHDWMLYVYHVNDSNFFFSFIAGPNHTLFLLRLLLLLWMSLLFCSCRSLNRFQCHVFQFHIYRYRRKIERSGIWCAWVCACRSHLSDWLFGLCSQSTMLSQQWTYLKRKTTTSKCV